MKASKQSHHRLLWLTVIDGWMGGLHLDFADGLNCLIGGRGAGKTTVLELLRFALDAGPDESDKEARRRFDSLLARNLKFGRVELGIETKEGLSYIVTRTADEPPVVLTAEREPTDLVLHLGNLFKADIFSQNQVEAIADRWDSQLALIDSFDQQAISQLTLEIRKVVDAMRSNATAIIPIRSRIITLREETKERKSIDEQLKGLAAKSGGQKSVLSMVHAQKALRDRELRAGQQIDQSLVEFDAQLKKLVSFMEFDTELSISEEMTKGPNGEIMSTILREIRQMSQGVDQSLEQARRLVQDQRARLTQFLAKLRANHGAQELRYRETLEKEKALDADNAQRATLEKRRSDLMTKEHELANLDKQISELESRQTDLTHHLAELRLQRFKCREAVAKQLTDGLQGDIRVGITQDGRPEQFREKLEDLLRGSRAQTADKEKIISALWPADFVRMVRTNNAQALIERTGVSKQTAERIIDFLAVSDRLHELETVERIDEPRIELNDNGEWNDSRDLSTGQKCTAILPILLMESEKPLLIDQPEDNLDNSYVSNTVVKTIQKVKSRRQMLFATHNPNIPVLGDAERVFVLVSTGKAGKLNKAGDVDQCKKPIINILEGGMKAFEERSKRYKK